METRTARCLRHGLLTSTALAGLGILPAAAGQLPTGYSTSFGSVGFQRSSGTLKINQGSPSAIVNYDSFSIGRHARVDIHQPGASSALLNRVTGTTTSVIAGRLTANGQVYLINPNGIAITKSGVVKVGGGFVASSLDMTDDEFKSGRTHFAGSGAGRVSNQGTITIGRGGYAALLGGKVMNGGTIAVPMGTVALGAGAMATLDVSGDGFLQVALPGTAGGKGALITNAGRISGTTVMIDAATARAAARNAVNISGPIDSHTISGHSGSIQIGGGDGGAVAISGRLSVASRNATGGSVTITGARIALHHAHIDARGALGGGTVKIGGDLQGSGTLAHAGTVTIDAKSVIRADATKQGAGGSVVVWSDETTHFAGLISAKGGAQGGDGGSAEVSSHGVLNYTGTTNLLAPHGKTGTLLLDPYDVVISSGTDSNTSLSSGTYTPSGTSVISNTELQTQLATANVTITTGALGSPGSDAGNITVAAPVTWSAAHILTLTAANAIAINAPITIAGAGGLALNAATNVSSAQPLISFGNGASVSYAVGSGSGITGQSLTINGTAYTLLYTLANSGSTGPDNGSSDVAGIDHAGDAGHYALATNLSGTGTTFTAALVGSGSSFTGTFNGLGHTISNLTISSSATYAGLFGQVGSGGTVANVGLVGGSVTDTTTGARVGALVGYNDGTITQAYATGAVSGTGSNARVGGLVGFNFIGTIKQAYATGAVSSTGSSAYVGGLVGYNDFGTITQAYATGAVSATGASSSVGGLVGFNFIGTIKQAYATGAVSAMGASSSVGGLVGDNTFGTITNGYYDATTTGAASGTQGDGSVGLTTAALQSTATTSVALGSAFAGGAAGGETGVYPYLTAFFPNGVQAVSGIAYSSGTTALASNASRAGLVTAVVNGVAQAPVTTGANGYYYVTLPAGTIASAGSSVLTYSQTLTRTTTSTPIGAVLTAPSGTVTNLTQNIAGGAFTGTTTALTYSSLGIPNAVVAALPTNLTATGASFTLDQTVTTGKSFSVTTGTGDPLTVAAPITITGAALTLASGGTLAIDAPITARGAVPVTLAYNTGAVTNLSFAEGDAITYTDTSGNALTASAGGTLSVNGTPYTLLYTLANSGSTGPDTGTSDVAGIDANSAAGGDGGNYALATNLSGTGTTFTAALVGSGSNSFTGTFNGLGHTISNLTINTSADNAGLFGTVGRGGTIANVGLVGGSVTDTADSAQVGGLAGYNYGGTITQAYTTGAISGGGIHAYIGGLVGFSSGTITQSYATGAVSGGIGFLAYVGGLVGSNGGTITQAYATGAVSGRAAAYVGGLVGFNSGTITQAYATGAVSSTGSNAYIGGLVGGNNKGTITQSYATGAVSSTGSSASVGGLVGLNSNGTITQAYATGAVSGGIGFSASVGGLVGGNSGTITQSYATGAVSSTGSSAYVGGLVGGNSGTITQSYATGAVSGGSDASVGGLVGLNYGTITQAYATGAVSGGSSASVGGLVGFNYKGTITASAYDSSTTGMSSGVGSGSSSGVSKLTTADLQSTGTANPFLLAGSSSPTGFAGGAAGGEANVYPYLTNFFPNGVQAITGTATAGTQVGFYAGGTLLGGTVSTGANGYVYQAVAAGTLPASGAKIGALVTPSGGTTPTGLVYTDAGTVTANVLALGAITTGLVNETTAKPTYSALQTDVAATFGATTVLPTSATAATSITAIAASGFTLDQAVTAGGAYTLTADGNVVLASTGSISATTSVLIAADGTFTNQAGANAISAASGFTIYTQDPTNPTGTLPVDTYGGLTGTNYYNDAYNFASGQFASAVPGGNHFVYAYAASLTPTLAGSATKTYDSTTTAPTTSLTLTASGLANAGGITDSATFSLTGASYDTSSAGTGKTVTATGIAFASNPNNYTLAATSASAAVGIVNRAALSLTGVIAASKTYDGTTATTLIGSANVTALLSDVVSVTGTGTGSFADKNVGTGKAVTVSGYGLSGTDAGNYTLVMPTNLTADITKADLTLSGLSAASKTYDGTTAATLTGSASVTALLADVVSVTGTGTGNFSDKNVGTGKAVIVSGYGLSGTDAGNYNLVANLTADISKADLSLTGLSGADSKTYDGTTATTLIGSASVIAIGSDVVSVTGTGTGNFNDKNVGTGKAVTVSGYGLSGTDAGNYTLVMPTNLTAAITPAALTITASNQTKTYGQTASLGTTAFTETGLVNGDSVTGVSLASTGAAASAGVASSPYAITASNAQGWGLSNYTIGYGNGALTVTPAALTITASNQTKTYGQTASLGTTAFTETGLVNGDSVTGVSLASTGAAASAGVAGSPYAITASNAQGSGLSNYTISYANGALTVNPASVSVTAASGTAIYGNVPANPGLVATGLQNGEGVSVLTGLSSSFALTSRTDAGTYALSVVGSNTNPNYTVTGTSDGSYTITPRPITITATDQTRLPGYANAPLAYQIGGLGLINSDFLTGALATSATRTSPPGAYPIVQGTLAATPNYAVTYVPGTLVLGSAPRAVSPATIVSAVSLASTAERAEQQVLGLPGDSRPLALSTVDGNGAGRAQIIDRLTDPRFGQVVVCVKDLCAVAAQRPKALMKQSSLETSR